MPAQRSASLVAFSGGVALFAGDSAETDLSQPIDVEIALSGQYKTRNFELGAKQFDEMIANHARAGVDPAVDREHESWFGMPGAPALGWVKGLRTQPASSDARRRALTASVQLTDLGQQAVRAGHYRYVSMGMDRAGKDRMTGEPIGHVLDHLALVKNPFIQGMRPLSLALSAHFGRPVEEEPMEQLAQMLRTHFGLAADASEEQIMAAYVAARERAAQQIAAVAGVQSERETLSKDLAEQRRVNALLEQGLKALQADADARAAAAWEAQIAAAVKEFRLTPAEGEAHKALTGAERSAAAKLLPLRQPHPPAPAVATNALTLARGTEAEGLNAAQMEAIAAYKKANPDASDHAAFAAAMVANPQLFTGEGA